jgi:hypothetical protein
MSAERYRPWKLDVFQSCEGSIEENTSVKADLIRGLVPEGFSQEKRDKLMSQMGESSTSVGTTF